MKFVVYLVNSCHFVDLLSLENNYFFFSFFNHVIQQPKTRGYVDHLRLDNAIAFGVAFHHYVCVAMYTTPEPCKPCLLQICTLIKILLHSMHS